MRPGTGLVGGCLTLARAAFPYRCRVVVACANDAGGASKRGGWCVDSVTINIDVSDVNHMDMDVNFFVVILCRTYMSVISTCMPLDVLGIS